ncbi:MAG: ribose 5-phosphate isomerase B [Clostridia bacterium]|nr:ribose 5-phosphate isomerase B [Clostridia bacterium]
MIAIGSDHGGINLKNIIKDFLDKKGLSYKDFGTYSAESCDYPDFAKAVCTSVVSGESEKGILVCGTGIGMSMAANKIKGIRAAHVTDTYSARMTKEHNDANVICLGERITGCDLALEIVNAYLEASFQGGRHEGRVKKVMAFEEE